VTLDVVEEGCDDLLRFVERVGNRTKTLIDLARLQRHLGDRQPLDERVMHR
jgi:hypothetical protein